MSNDLTVLSLFAGLGGGTLGFLNAGFKSVGAIDLDAGALRALEVITQGRARGTVADLAELTPEGLRAICGERRPDVVLTSPPCVAFSGCLPLSKSREPRYLELSSLAERGVWLCLEAWDEPPPLVLLENVPRIQSRGREWLDRLGAMLRGYGYAWRETSHDCGELGGLGQRRRRFLGVARHTAQVPEFLYQPPRQRLRGIGEVIGHMPSPAQDDPANPLHRLPRLSGLNWLRLALIGAGQDWRALPPEVRLRERAARQNGGYGVQGWADPAHAVVAHAAVATTWSSVADPRSTCQRREGALGVTGWEAPSTTVIGHASPQNGPWQVADPRLDHEPRGGGHGVQDWGAPARTVIGQAEVQRGAVVADPRLTCAPRSGAYGVTGWGEASATVVAAACHDNGAYAVADPTWPVATHEVVEGEIWGPPLDLEAQQLLVIRAADGTWHRPLTTLELAALQGLPVQIGGAWLDLGVGHAQARRWIGNAIPVQAAEAIARECRRTLEASRRGGLLLSGTPVWVSPSAQEEAGA